MYVSISIYLSEIPKFRHIMSSSYEALLVG